MNGKLWLPEEIEYMKAHYPDERSDKVALALGRSLKSVYAQAKILGVKKSTEFMASPDSGGFQKGSKVGSSYHFPKGHKPFNKGKKQSDYCSKETIEKTIPTRFKPGQKIYNEKHDGAIVLRNDHGVKNYFVRISKGKWIYLKNKIWEDNFGPISKGFVIRLKDGNTLNCIRENLECISKKENMSRNTIHNIPEELKPIVKLNNKLKKTIYEKSK